MMGQLAHACVIAHSIMLQSSASSVPPHAAPPFLAETSTARRRVRLPPPHDAEHSPHGSHNAMTHATMQSAASANAGHSAPLRDGRVTMALVRVMRPAAASHGVHALHLPTAQSTQHADASSSGGHALPPFG
jgi:hypothetical protein